MTRIPESELERRRPPAGAPDADAPCTAEAAECTCPDFCERDHEND